MTEQLDLNIFLESKEEKPASKAPAAKPRPVKKITVEDTLIENRIQALVDQNLNRSTEVTTTLTTRTTEVPVKEVAVKAEPQVLTVSDINRGIKTLLEKNFTLLWVKGEISNFKIPASGHLYFTLKDSKSQIKAVMFKGFAQGLKFKPEDGMEVLVRCKVTAYEPRGDYQLFCEVIEPVGFGALQVAFEKLKTQLQKEGLFDLKRKKPLPAFPTRIGIITSPTGAAIRDMINVLSRRFGGGLDITIIPSSVQGDKAAGELIAALDLVNKMGPSRFDVIIIGRGGGSLEDLWSFNIEEVVRAVARCTIPIISAVGHEVDFTICDFVADLRAPTPSAAAELVVKNKADLADRVGLLKRQFTQLFVRKLQISRTHLEQMRKRLVDPKRRLQDLMLRCDEWSERLSQTMSRFLQNKSADIRLLKERLGTPEKLIEVTRQKLTNMEQRMSSAVQSRMQKKSHQFGQLASLLNGLSPLAVLDRGYSIVKKDGQVIKEASQMKGGDQVKITLHKGEVEAQIL